MKINLLFIGGVADGKRQIVDIGYSIPIQVEFPVHVSSMFLENDEMVEATRIAYTEFYNLKSFQVDTKVFWLGIHEKFSLADALDIVICEYKRGKVENAGSVDSKLP